MLVVECRVCPLPCHDTADGVADSVWAAARTPDGSTFVAYVVSHVDRQLSYAMTCSEGACFCSANVDSDATTAALHVVGVTSAGGLGGPFVMPIPPPAPLGIGDPGKSIDLRGVGPTLALGIRILASTGLIVRVITLDSTMIGGPGLLSARSRSGSRSRSRAALLRDTRGCERHRARGDEQAGSGSGSGQKVSTA